MKQIKRFYNNKYFLIFLWGITILYFSYSINKTKYKLRSSTGVILSIKNRHEKYKKKDSISYRYIQLSDYEKPFEIYFANKLSDFKQELQRIDSLKTGDTITVYYEESFNTKLAFVNSLVYFIDKKNEAFFVKGKTYILKNFILFILISCCLAGLFFWADPFAKMNKT